MAKFKPKKGKTPNRFAGPGRARRANKWAAGTRSGKFVGGKASAAKSTVSGALSAARPGRGAILRGRMSVSPETKTMGTLLYLLFAGIGFFQVFTWELTLALKTVMAAVFAAVFFAGLIGGREARPMMGIIAISFIAVAMLFTNDATFLNAVFGPIIANPMIAFSEDIIAPLGTSLDGAVGGIGCNLQSITTGKQCSAPDVKGTKKSIEIEKHLSEFPYIAGESEADGAFTIANYGRFEATNIVLEVSSPVIDTTTGTRDQLVKIGNMEVTDCGFEGELQTATKCVWPSMSEYENSKADIRTASVKATWAELQRLDPKFRNNKQIRFPITTSFDYEVDTLHQTEVFEEGDRPNRERKISESTGGPIIASIETFGNFYAESEEFVSVTVLNSQLGNAENINFCVYMPVATNFIRTGAKSISPEDPENDCIPVDNTIAAKCSFDSLGPKDNELGGSDQSRCQFRISYDVVGSLTLTGRGVYTYIEDNTIKGETIYG